MGANGVHGDKVQGDYSTFSGHGSLTWLNPVHKAARTSSMLISVLKWHCVGVEFYFWSELVKFFFSFVSFLSVEKNAKKLAPKLRWSFGQSGRPTVPSWLRHRNPAETRRNPAEILREVKILAIAREFRGNGNLNPGYIYEANQAHMPIGHGSDEW